MVIDVELLSEDNDPLYIDDGSPLELANELLKLVVKLLEVLDRVLEFVEEGVDARSVVHDELVPVAVKSDVNEELPVVLV